MSERWATHTKPRMKPEEVKHDIAYRKQFAPKPAEPVTDAGKANNWMPADDGGVQYARISKPRVALIEAQAQDLILSDVEGLALALFAAGLVANPRSRVAQRDAEAILTAWRQERQR